jgi:hypothetical protein
LTGDGFKTRGLGRIPLVPASRAGCFVFAAFSFTRLLFGGEICKKSSHAIRVD